MQTNVQMQVQPKAQQAQKTFLEKALAIAFYAVTLGGLALFQYHTHFFWQ